MTDYSKVIEAATDAFADVVDREYSMPFQHQAIQAALVAGLRELAKEPVIDRPKQLANIADAIEATKL